MTLLWHYYEIHYNIHYDTGDHYDTIITLLSQHYDTIITLLSHYYDTFMTILWLYYHTIMTVFSQYYNTFMIVLYILWRNICTPFLGMCRPQSFTWTRGNYNEVSIKFGAWFQPTGGRTATMESSWSELSSTIIHIISSIIQFIADVWPGLQQL